MTNPGNSVFVHYTQFYLLLLFISWPVGRSYRTHRMHFCRGVKKNTYESLGYDGDVSVMLELWGMWNTSPLPFWHRVVVLILNWFFFKIELFLILKLCTYAELFEKKLLLHRSSLPSLPGPLSTGVVAPDRVLSMNHIELRSFAKLNCLNRTVLDIETVHLY